mgnify:CR=1 FL=1|tara:strand:+ start:29 stop:292 length:264 start_codon:yes stop_codon:yes gene_type:complete
MTDIKKNMTDERVKEFKNYLFKWSQNLADTADKELLQWIDHNKITRKEAEQIAKLEGHFVEERLQLLLDKELGDNEAIFEDDEIREK